MVPLLKQLRFTEAELDAFLAKSRVRKVSGPVSHHPAAGRARAAPKVKIGRIPHVAALSPFLGLPDAIAEYRFAPPRKWRFDWAWPDRMVAVEQEGGVWIQGRHSRGAGMVKDMAKYNAAAAMGWRVLRFTPQQIASGAALELVRETLLKPIA